MLTTGGGWQDQVGGLLPGIKFSESPASLPLSVEFEVLDVPESFIATLNQHMICIYTGPLLPCLTPSAGLNALTGASNQQAARASHEASSKMS